MRGVHPSAFQSSVCSLIIPLAGLDRQSSGFLNNEHVMSKSAILSSTSSSYILSAYQFLLDILRIRSISPTFRYTFHCSFTLLAHTHTHTHTKTHTQKKR